MRRTTLVAGLLAMTVVVPTLSAADSPQERYEARPWDHQFGDDYRGPPVGALLQQRAEDRARERAWERAQERAEERAWRREMERERRDRYEDRRRDRYYDRPSADDWRYGRYDDRRESFDGIGAALRLLLDQ